MRLLHTKVLHFEELFENECPEYAILSHRWYAQEQEVTYRDFLGGEKRDSRGYAKIVATCKKALAQKNNWIWIDTCGIGKNSSTELSEAINRMFCWYQSAAECYVSLSNVSGEETETRSLPSRRLSFSQQDLPAMHVLNAKSLDFKDRAYSILLHRWQYDEKTEQDYRWFARGWAIQELLATLDNPIVSQEPCSQSGLVYLETLCGSAIGRTPRNGRGFRKNRAYWESLHTSPQQDMCFLPLFSCFETSLQEPLDSQPHHNEGLDHRAYGIFPDAREPKIMKTSDPFVGDEEFGPNFGEPDMSREDDDDDNCVGFRRFSGVANRATNLIGGEGGLNWSNANTQLQGETLGGIIPKFGPPKRDPVAATLGSPVRYCADQTTLRVWKDAIARTCGMDTGFSPMAAKKWEEIGWKGAWEMHGNTRGEGRLMCAY